MSESFWDGEIQPTETHEPISPETGLGYASAEKPLKGQDFVITDNRRGLYAVFDGMGGVGDTNAGKDASTHAASLCSRAYAGVGIGTDIAQERELMVKWMKQAHQSMHTEVGEAGTTATALRMVKQNDELHAVWASVGDSRLYLFRDGGLYILTEDESTNGHTLYNCIGVGSMQVNQVGSLKLAPEDRLMLCSDGITGDYEPDLLENSEIITALSLPTSQEAASELLTKSRKRDDKSVIVVDFVGSQAEMPQQASPESRPKSLYEHRLGPREVFRIEPDKPIEDRGGYSITAFIKAANVELILLDLRNTAVDEDGRRRPFGKSSGSWYGDFLLVDESFGDYLQNPLHDPTGYKTIRAGDNLPIGRNYTYERFNFPNTVSREHFRIAYNEDANAVTVTNLEPLNNTTVKVSKDIYSS